VNVAEARKRLVKVRKWQLLAKRLQRRGAWDWASVLEYGYSDGYRVSFLTIMACKGGN
jgi:hypothetical protein